MDMTASAAVHAADDVRMIADYKGQIEKKEKIKIDL